MNMEKLKCVVLSERSQAGKSAYCMQDSYSLTFWKRQRMEGVKKSMDDARVCGEGRTNREFLGQ